MKKILLTGSAGFIGHHVFRRLAALEPKALLVPHRGLMDGPFIAEYFTKAPLCAERVRDAVLNAAARGMTEEEIKDSYDTLVERDKGTYEGKAGSWATAANNGTTLYYTPAGVRRVKQILTKFKDEDQAAIDEANKQVTDASSAVSAAQARSSRVMKSGRRSTEIQQKDDLSE